MTAATLFSGIGAPEMAMPDWEWIWHAEIEPFPSAVMAARHPASANLGDVTADDFCTRALAIGRPDVLVFGSPCQSFSVAGRRLGMDDPRGNLAIIALRRVAELEPDWFVFENVPGLLSSGQRQDFGTFLGAVDDIGYSASWAVLDAQYRGVAQRRKRVFVVGGAGDWRRPAAVLLEPESLCGHPPSRGEAREDVAGTLASRTSAGGGLGTDFDLSGGVVAGTVSAGDGRRRGASITPESLISHCLNAGGMGRIDYESETLIVHPLLAKANSSRDDSKETYVIAHALRADGFDASEDGTGRGTPLVAAFNHQSGGDMRGIALRETAQLQREQVPAVLAYGIRRLMPVECERLQGFPDGYTAIAYRGKSAKDGPRYKAIGNSMAVPVLRWILSRIDELGCSLQSSSAPKEGQ